MAICIFDKKETAIKIARVFKGKYFQRLIIYHDPDEVQETQNFYWHLTGNDLPGNFNRISLEQIIIAPKKIVFDSTKFKKVIRGFAGFCWAIFILGLLGFFLISLVTFFFPVGLTFWKLPSRIIGVSLLLSLVELPVRVILFLVETILWDFAEIP